MKSIVPAALVLVLEAGFLFSIAALPSPSQRGVAQVAARPAAAVLEAPATVRAPCSAEATAAASAGRPGSRS